MAFSDTPLVSILTPSYNQAVYIEKTILSVLKQDYPRIEYIVMDSASNDGTAAVLDKQRSRISKVIQEKDNGQSDALNKGFKLVNGEILAYLNSDDVYANSTVVSDAVRALKENPDFDVVYGNRYTVDVEGRLLHYEPFAEFSAENLYDSCYLPQECAFWTKEIYDRAGGYVDAAIRFAMDYELWLRFLSVGAKFKALNQVFGLFRSHETSKSVAQWRDIGYIEASGHQAKYAAYRRHICHMYDVYNKHHSGIDRNEKPRQARIADKLWKSHLEAARALYGSMPSDQWTYSVFDGDKS